MKNVTVKRTVTIAMTAAQWQLYNNESEEAAIAAERINRCVETYFDVGCTKSQVQAHADKVMRMPKYAALGASDTEPRYMLKRLLDELFPEEK